MDKENPNKEGLYFHNDTEKNHVEECNEPNTRLLLEIVHKLGRIADALEEANMQDG